MEGPGQMDGRLARVAGTVLKPLGALHMPHARSKKGLGSHGQGPHHVTDYRLGDFIKSWHESDCARK